ncbi:MAG: hypothetical protein A2X84_01940, partial [Desulfuromonadaceae bacterium GWC2_58_13]
MVALLAAMAVAAPAFAITGDVSGFLHVRGVAADNMDGRDKDGGLYDDNTRAVDERLRLYTTAALNENVKAVFTVEVDYTWGDNDDNNATGDVGQVGADTKSQIEIANLYLDFNIPEANTNVKAGTHYFKLGGGLILGEHASGVSVRKAFNDNLNLGLYWVKVVEGAVAADDQDLDYYQAQLDMKVGDMTITPFLGYYDADDGPVMDDETEQYYYGLELKGKAAALDYSAVAFYNDGRVNGAHNDAFAFLANAGYTLGDTKLLAEVGRYGDSDSGTGEMVMIAGYNNFSEILTGGYFDTRSGDGGGTDQSVANNTIGRVRTGNSSYYMNFQYAKLGVEQKVHEKGKVRAYYIYAQEAADNHTRTVDGNSHKRITFGHEIDAY